MINDRINLHLTISSSGSDFPLSISRASSIVVTRAFVLHPGWVLLPSSWWLLLHSLL
jgi:hypothetical protein